MMVTHLVKPMAIMTGFPKQTLRVTQMDSPMQMGLNLAIRSGSLKTTMMGIQMD